MRIWKSFTASELFSNPLLPHVVAGGTAAFSYLKALHLESFSDSVRRSHKNS